MNRQIFKCMINGRIKIMVHLWWRQSITEEKKLTPGDSNAGNPGSQLFSVTTGVFSPVVIFDVFSIVL